jgi:glycosyl transferase family 25
MAFVTAGLPAIFIISLKHSAERRALMTARLNELKLPHAFFDAVDGAALDPDTSPDYDGLRRRLFFGRDLTRGEIGCTLSHRAVLQKIVDENIPHALILEDDARMKDDLPGVLSALMADKNWDMVRFLGRPKTLRDMRDIRPLCGPYSLTRAFGTPGGAYAYLVTRDAAARLLPFMQRNWQPNDMILGQTWRTGLDVYAVSPAAIWADDDIESTIGEERNRKSKDSLRGWEKIAHYPVRAAFKLWENAGKRAAWSKD